MSDFSFIFDYRSPYAYLANTQIHTLPVQPTYVPVDIVAVMDIVGNQPSPKCPAKARYAGLDAARWAALYQVPFNANRALMQAMGKGEIAPDLFARAALAAQHLGVFAPFHEALFNAYWGTPVDLVSAQSRLAFLKHLQIDQDVWAEAEKPFIAEQLASHVQHAAKQGVFGAPSFLVGDELFFGNDRLAMVRHALEAKHV